MNLSYFLKTLWNEEERLRIQPAFILAGLAMSTLMKSSEVELRGSGRSRAMWFAEGAKAALVAAWDAAEWVDATLAEAALVGHSFF